jgi:Secretion system C-terminal sorting domain
VIADDFRSVNLRSERSGVGNGRVYTIHVAVSDANGNVGTSSLQVHVQLDLDTPVVDDGPVYEVLGATVPEPLAKGNGEAAQPEITNLPKDFHLKQNYPNPFNPTTTIDFAVPQSGFYTLKIYNTLGQEIAELVNGQLQAGSYSRSFEASRLASGLYIYTLKGNNVTISKKMILLR